MRIEKGTDFSGKTIMFGSFDDRGNDVQADTVGSYELVIYRRDMNHHNPMQPDLSSPCYSYRWDLSYHHGSSICDGIADGYADSFEACVSDFLELWPAISGIHTCEDPRLRDIACNNYGTPYQW